jgi:hypothetical protein
VKIAFNLPTSTVDYLKSTAPTAQERGTTVTQLIKDAIGTERYLTRKRGKGAKVLVHTADGSLKELVFE